MLGVSCQRADQLSREPGFPDAFNMLPAGAVWLRSEFENYFDRCPADRRFRDARITGGRSRPPPAG
jgi:hypothetical protein